jgi:hypothetical protein
MRGDFMPPFEVLYYPYYEPPMNWARSSLLFFDSFKTIVPKDTELNLSPSMQEIINIEPKIFSPIDP